MRAFLLGAALSLALLFSPTAADLAQIWALPTTEVAAQTVNTYYRGSLKVEEVYYQSRLYKGRPVKIFAYFVYPRSATKLPAILLVHGGGGTASLSRTLAWARRGYAILTIDLPGKGEKRWASKSTGPDMDVAVLLRTRPDPTYNYLVHAVAAARNGISYLAQRKEVDPARIGLVGLSWGGVVTLLTNGQDKRLKTAVNVFGAGYIPEDCTWQDWFNNKTPAELAEWYDNIDPKNFLRSQHAPILFVTGTNDHCYYLPIFQKSYFEVGAPKHYYLVANLRHAFFPDTQAVVWNWLDAQLKTERSFPRINLLPLFSRDNKIIIPVRVSASFEITKATLYYSLGAPSRWTIRKWLAVTDYHEQGDYFFGLNKYLINPELLFYVTVKDHQGGAASTPVRSLFKVRLTDDQTAYAVSAPLTQTYFHATPLQFVGVTIEPQYTGISYSKAEKVYSLIKLKDADGSP